MLLIDAFETYLETLRERQLSQVHIETVTLRFSRFIEGREGVFVSDVKPEAIEAHFRELAGRGLANGTLAGYKATQRAFWRWAAAQGWIESNPSDVLNQRKFNYEFKPVNHQPADRDDFQAVVDALMPFAAHRKFSARDVRDALAVSIAIDSSVRRGEIWNLRRRDVERALKRGRPIGDGRQVYVTRVTGKTTSVLVRFFDESAHLGRLWLERMPDGAAWLFCSLRTGKQLHVDYMGSCFKRICRFAGVPVFRYQAVRKRTVMDAIALSGDPKVGQLLAGHKDSRTTGEYYNLLQEEQVNAAAAALATARRGRPKADGDDLARAFFRPMGDT